MTEKNREIFKIFKFLIPIISSLKQLIDISDGDRDLKKQIHSKKFEIRNKIKQIFYSKSKNGHSWKKTLNPQG